MEGRYFVSTLGRLASNRYRGVIGRIGIISPAPDAKGYLRTVFFLNGKYSTVKAHRVVAALWIGEIPVGMTIHHRDFNPANNAVTNLEIITLKENIRHSARAGRYGKSRGEINGNAKLTADDVRQIRLRRSRGELQRVLGDEFKISKMSVRRIETRQTWKHVA